MIDPEGKIPEYPHTPRDVHHMNHLDYARRDLDYLMAEIELRQLHNVHIVYNIRKASALHKLEAISAATLKKHYDQKIDLDSLKQQRPECEFTSYLLDVVEEREQLRITFDSVIWRLYLSSTQ